MSVKILFIMILPFILISSFAGTFNSVLNNRETELYIIGTVHESTYKFNSDTLLNILNVIDPDVILLESDSSYMTSDFKLKDDVKNEFPETSAITKYLKDQSALLRPYDISGRDEFLDDPERLYSQYDLFNKISSMKLSGNFPAGSADIYSRIMSMMDLAEKMSFSTASYINSAEGSSNIDTINYYTYEGIKKLIDITPGFEIFKTYWAEECNYWNKRNDVMIRNILKYIKAYDGKKIVVLCGFAHKNILRNGILEKAGKDISIKELRDI